MAVKQAVEQPRAGVGDGYEHQHGKQRQHGEQRKLSHFLESPLDDTLWDTFDSSIVTCHSIRKQVAGLPQALYFRPHRRPNV